MQQNETSTPDNLVIGVGYDNGGIHGVSPSTWKIHSIRNTSSLRTFRQTKRFPL